MKNIELKSTKELKVILEKVIEARKVVKERTNDLFVVAWRMKYAKDRLDYAIRDSRRELGKRKAKGCKAFGSQLTRFSLRFFSCEARELSCNSFRKKEDLWFRHCCTCRWKPAQAQTRMVIIRIKGGKRT